MRRRRLPRHIHAVHATTARHHVAPPATLPQRRRAPVQRPTHLLQSLLVDLTGEAGLGDGLDQDEGAQEGAQKEQPAPVGGGWVVDTGEGGGRFLVMERV